MIADLIKTGLGFIKDKVSEVLVKHAVDAQTAKAIEEEVEKAVNETAPAVIEIIEKEIEEKARIVALEIGSGDSFTRRMRPFVGYSGPVLVFLAYVIVPICEAIFKFSVKIDIPNAYWVGWGTVISIYAIGRTVEKRNGNGQNIIGKIVEKISK